MALPDGVIDLIVTSPPYIGVIDYTHANRLLYAWMGWSMEHERRKEIGARFRRNRIAAVAEYLEEMRAARDEIWRVLRPGAFCAIVIGESRKFPGTVEHMVADFDERMPLVWGPISRRASRRRVSDREAREGVEYVCVFRKP
jgi:DNA modification methylase